MNDSRIIVGDCLDVLRDLDAGSVSSCVTSPPYFGLRDYGADGQIGLEATPAEYVSKLVAVFREVRRVLRDDGTLWLNLGDSYGAFGGNTYAGFNERWNGTGGAGSKQNATLNGVTTHKAETGLRPKNLLGIPWRVAFALQEDGWWLRQDIIWSKPNPMPESVRDRCTKAHEYIFLLSKSERYYFDTDAIAEPSAYPGDNRALRPDKRKVMERMCRDGGSRFRTGNPTGLTRNRRSVWTVGSEPYAGAHFAVFPSALIEPCVLAGSPPCGVVLDPFFGAGTTGVVAVKHGRRYVGVEINQEYAGMAAARIADAERQGDIFVHSTTAPAPTPVQDQPELWTA